MARLVIGRSTLMAAAFAAVSAVPAAYLFSTSGNNDASRLAQTGASLSLLAIIVVGLLLLAGMILIVLGRRRSRDTRD